MAKAAPRPIFRFLDQPALYGIAVNVAQLLDALALSPHVEIVIAGLPEVLEVTNQPSRNRLFDGLHRAGQRSVFRFADQQMHVLGHDHIADYIEVVASPALFQRDFKQMHRAGARQQRLTLVATEGDEVKVSSFLITLQSARHTMRIAGLRKLSVMDDTCGRDGPALAKTGLERGTQISFCDEYGCKALLAGPPATSSTEPRNPLKQRTLERVTRLRRRLRNAKGLTTRLR